MEKQRALEELGKANLIEFIEATFRGLKSESGADLRAAVGDGELDNLTASSDAALASSLQAVGIDDAGAADDALPPHPLPVASLPASAP